jgi:hypothetical protein
MKNRSKSADLGPQSELGPFIKSLRFSLPVEVHQRVLQFRGRTGFDKKAVIHDALREQVAWIEAHKAARRPVERWDLFPPLELVNRLMDVCDFNGLDCDWVTEFALPHRPRQDARQPGNASGGKSRKAPTTAAMRLRPFPPRSQPRSFVLPPTPRSRDECTKDRQDRH